MEELKKIPIGSENGGGVRDRCEKTGIAKGERNKM